MMLPSQTSMQNLLGENQDRFTGTMARKNYVNNLIESSEEKKSSSTFADKSIKFNENAEVIAKTDNIDSSSDDESATRMQQSFKQRNNNSAYILLSLFDMSTKYVAEGKNEGKNK